MVSNHLSLAFYWIIYCVLHSVLADIRVKAFFQKKWNTYYQYYRLGYNLFAFVGLALILWFQLSIKPIHLFKITVPLQTIGVLIAIGGLALMLVCIKKYFSDLSGLLSLKRKKLSPPLIISGVHRYVRHPLYLGTFIFIWGLVILFPMLSLLISNVIITAYTIIGIGLEEKKLVIDFGEHYQSYQKNVPKLVPKMRLARCLNTTNAKSTELADKGN